MAKIVTVEDKVLKDEMGNGLFYLKMVKKKLIGRDEIYSFRVYRDETNKISGCLLEKSMLEGNKKYIFELKFFENDPASNKMTYRRIDMGYDHTFDVLNSDVMFSNKLRKEENKVLAEFDAAMWADSHHTESKSTIIDLFTDVIDTTERDDTVVNGMKISDNKIIHVGVKGFFAEVKANTDNVNG